jgi:putative nucleotidyltransferase with HDIG domain
MGLARAVADELNGAYFPLDTDRDTGRAIVTTSQGERMELDFAVLRGGSLEADLLARDFTINALAVDETGLVVDATGGQGDLQARLVRATSERAFRDDAARLLRAVRMEAELGFEIEPQTTAWLHRDAPLLTQSATERVRDEFVRLLTLPNGIAPLQRLDELGLLVHVLPELESLKGVPQSAPHRFDVWRHTLVTADTLEGVVAAAKGQEIKKRTLADAPSTAWGDLMRTLGRFSANVTAHLGVEISGGRDRAALLKLATLLHDVGKPKTLSQDETAPDGQEPHIRFYNHEMVGAQVAAARLRELRFSRDEVERVHTIVGQHLRPLHLARAEKITRRAVYRFFRATSCGGVDVVLLSLADYLATYGPHLREERWNRRLEVAETLLTHWFEQYHQTVAPPPLITGSDLMAELELEAGPQIGRLLETVREAQAAREVETREQALALARRILKVT